MGIQPLTSHEYFKIRDLLISVCGITLSDDQDYLVETRLTDLGNELGANTFGDLHRMLVGDTDELLPKVIDLMTTNETFWFRDNSCWNTLENLIIPELLDSNIRDIKIWSAACSTGQEPYSLAILIDEICQKKGKPDDWNRFEIMGTDISHSALFLAQNGRYDSFNIKRGLSENRKLQYFTKKNTSWIINENIRKRVKFKQFNLLDSLFSLGKFHLVLCRNVAIYFSSDFKKDLFSRIARIMHKDGSLIIGATESLMGFSNDFKTMEFKSGVYYRPKI